jgi:hypothetical protein
MKMMKTTQVKKQDESPNDNDQGRKKKRYLLSQHKSHRPVARWFCVTLIWAVYAVHSGATLVLLSKGSSWIGQR